MSATHASLVTDIVSGILLGSSGDESRNQWSFDGLASKPRSDGGIDLAADQLSASNVRIVWGPHTLEVRRLSLRCLTARLDRAGASLRVGTVDASGAELSGVTLSGPLAVPPALGQLWSSARRAAPAPVPPTAATPAGSVRDEWRLEPLAAAEGSLRAQIADAHLVFDADVTIPVHGGQVDFNRAKVQHVGPDSWMGVSRMGIYVDAPNGRHYLYQFDGAPLSGVELEQRGSLLAGGVADRGRLALQLYAEAVLRQAATGTSQGLTEQARLLLERTALKGHLHLGDGTVAAPGLQARLHGRDEGRNRARVNSDAVGRGITLEVPALAVKQTAGTWQGSSITCDTLDAQLALRLAAEGGSLRFALDFASLTASGVRLTGAQAH
jgi:hypothetical protein